MGIVKKMYKPKPKNVEKLRKALQKNEFILDGTDRPNKKK